MIPVTRISEPPVLAKNAARWLEALESIKSNNKATKAQINQAQNKYRHPQVKDALVGLRQKTNREKPQLQSPLGIYFEKPKIAETQIYQGKSQIEVNPLSRNGLSLFC